MDTTLRLGTIGLLLIASFAAPATHAEQPLDEPAPFGVIQFSPDEAWIDLPTPLGDTWSAALAVLTELKYAVRADAPYMESNGQIRVADLWVAVEPHGSRETSFTRIRIALDAADNEYTQVRAEVILDAIATRLAPSVPAPAPAPTAVQPVDPAVQDVYTGEPVDAGAYAYATPDATIYNTYNTYNTYNDYVSYPVPYYAHYGHYASFGNYFPYWSCWKGYWGGYYASPWTSSWAHGPTFTYWGSPWWGFSYGYGCSPWWNIGFAGSWGNFCTSIGYPWYPWGGGGGDLVVVINNNNDFDANDNGGQNDFGDDVADGASGSGKTGNGGIGLNPRADGTRSKGTAMPVAGGSLADSGSRRSGGAGTAADGISRSPRGGTDSRDGGMPRIQVTHRERNDAATRFDPRTTVTRTVDTRTVADRGARDSGGGASTGAALGSASALPRLVGSVAPRGTAKPGKVVRLSAPSYTPGFAGVVPGASRPVTTVGGSSEPYGISRGGNAYTGAPEPVASRPTTPSAPTPVFQAPGSSSRSSSRGAPVFTHPGSSGSAPAASAPPHVSAPPPSSAPRVSAPSPAPAPSAPRVSAPSAPRVSAPSPASPPRASSPPRSSPPSSAGPGSSGSAGSSSSPGGRSSSSGGRGRP